MNIVSARQSGDKVTTHRVRDAFIDLESDAKKQLRLSKVDYVAKAGQLLRMAEKAKKAHGAATKSLLKYPDELISGALRLANQDV